MSGAKDILKGGWHPKGKLGPGIQTASSSADHSSTGKDGGKESWRGDFKGINQVAGWVGKGKDSSPTTRGLEHQSTPLSALKDPDTFGPPPKRNISTELPTAGSSSGAGVGSARPPVPARQQAAVQDEETAGPPPVPYRADTTGLRTTNLPPPPVRRADGDSQSPASHAANLKTKPKLPPRLPPRTAAIPETPPPAYNDSVHRDSGSMLNQGAIDRLGRAGVSVPGFGIGRNASPPLPPRTGSTSPTRNATPAGHANQLGELQARFSKINTRSSESASQGTTWEQKRAALKTASDFRKDPSTISLADARSAASTANNFRERHGEQAAAGWKAANNLNQKYGVMDKVRSSSSEDGQLSNAPPEPSSPSRLGKRAPPPPPAKKKELHGAAVEPPPVPLGSKPRPS
jgi:hypothetical protein